MQEWLYKIAKVALKENTSKSERFLHPFLTFSLSTP